MRRVSIVILTYNSDRVIGPCLESMRPLFLQTEVIVVDNASSDETRRVVERFEPGVRLIANTSNRGCAGGNNVGWRDSRGDIVIFANPDIEVTPGWLREILAPFEDPQVGIAGSLLLYPDSNTIQHAGGVIYPNAMVDHFGNGEENAGQWDDLTDVDYVTGASIAVRRTVLEETGGFDEDFNPAYYEETDLCRRARDLGWRVVMAPRSVAFHHESTILQRKSPRFLHLFYRARMRYVVKHFGLRDLLLTWLPAEIMWMFTPHASGGRLRQIRAYGQGVAFAWERRRRAREPRIRLAS